MERSRLEKKVAVNFWRFSNCLFSDRKRAASSSCQEAEKQVSGILLWGRFVSLEICSKHIEATSCYLRCFLVSLLLPVRVLVGSSFFTERNCMRGYACRDCKLTSIYLLAA